MLSVYGLHVDFIGPINAMTIWLGLTRVDTSGDDNAIDMALDRHLPAYMNKNNFNG